MPRPTLRRVTMREHSEMLGVDVVRPIGWTIDRHDGVQGRIFKTRREALDQVRAAREVEARWP